MELPTGGATLMMLCSCIIARAQGVYVDSLPVQKHPKQVRNNNNSHNNAHHHRETDFLSSSGDGSIEGSGDGPSSEEEFEAVLKPVVANVPMLEELEWKWQEEDQNIVNVPPSSCHLNTTGVPQSTFIPPFNRIQSSYVDQSLLIVSMQRCSPLSTYYKMDETGNKEQCSEHRFHGDYPLKCVEGHFRHGINRFQKVHKIACAPCFPELNNLIEFRH